MKKVILITGASSGMGKETAKALIQQGHTVYAAARRNDQMEGLQQLVGHPIQMDITQEAEIDHADNTVIQSEGKSMKKLLLIFLLLATERLAFAQASKPFILGSIDEIQSAQLSEKRILNIYFPEGYNQKDTVRYPVIYLLDGSADEDFIHIAGLVQYANFSWVNILPKSIVVGIANVDRRRDFTFPTTIEKDKKDFPTTGKSARFISFIEKELQPYIEKKYKTNKSKTIIGQSLGGLLAAEILIKKPELFSKYIIISPSLWWDKESLLRQDIRNLKNYSGQKRSIYIGVGSEGDIMINDAKKLTEILNQSNPKKLTTTFQFFEKENHATIFHQAVYQAFEALYEKAP